MDSTEPVTGSPAGGPQMRRLVTSALIVLAGLGVVIASEATSAAVARGEERVVATMGWPGGPRDVRPR